ncbi:hypothetical protein Dimus_006874 [Dionaea muscipula]
MKGGVAGSGIGVSPYPLPAKRRWRGLAIAVLGLVILSMLVPLVFLLGLHNGFHNPGSVSEQQSSSVRNNLEGYDQLRSSNTGDQPKQGQSEQVDELIKAPQPAVPKVNNSYSKLSMVLYARHSVILKVILYEVLISFKFTCKELLTNRMEKVVNATDRKGSMQVVQQSEDLSRVQHAQNTIPDMNVVKFSNSDTHVESGQILDENELSCEPRFGSYCLWRREYREDMKDSVVKKLKDRLFVARAYYPSIAKLPAHDKLSQEIRQNIQEFERILSEATLDTDLPSQ